jgi:hypothetical protein
VNDPAYRDPFSGHVITTVGEAVTSADEEGAELTDDGRSEAATRVQASAWAEHESAGSTRVPTPLGPYTDEEESVNRCIAGARRRGWI